MAIRSCKKRLRIRDMHKVISVIIIQIEKNGISRSKPVLFPVFNNLSFVAPQICMIDCISKK